MKALFHALESWRENLLAGSDLQQTDLKKQYPDSVYTHFTRKSAYREKREREMKAAREQARRHEAYKTELSRLQAKRDYIKSEKFEKIRAKEQATRGEEVEVPEAKEPRKSAPAVKKSSRALLTETVERVVSKQAPQEDDSQFGLHLEATLEEVRPAERTEAAADAVSAWLLPTLTPALRPSSPPG